jgi:hypothetical protein
LIKEIEIAESEEITIVCQNMRVRVVGYLSGVKTIISPGRIGMQHTTQVDERTTLKSVGALIITTMPSKEEK